MEKYKEKYKVVNTKVKPEVWRQLKRICAKKDLSIYDMLQMMCDCLVRYMDDRHNLTPELEQAMSVFEHMTGWKNAFNHCDPSTGKEVCETVVVCQDPKGKKTGHRVSMVRKPFMGQVEQTENIVQIYERMTEVLLPEIYRKLRMLAVDMDCNSIVDLMHLMIDSQTVRQLEDELRRDFEDANRAENGKAVEYGHRTRRKKHVSPDSISQQTIMFGDEDCEQAEREANDMPSIDWLEDNAGFSPHGGDW